MQKDWAFECRSAENCLPGALASNLRPQCDFWPWCSLSWKVNNYVCTAAVIWGLNFKAKKWSKITDCTPELKVNQLDSFWIVLRRFWVSSHLENTCSFLLKFLQYSGVLKSCRPRFIYESDFFWKHWWKKNQKWPQFLDWLKNVLKSWCEN